MNRALVAALFGLTACASGERAAGVPVDSGLEPPERDARITRGVTSFAEVEAAFADSVKNPGWVEVQWSKPTGAALESVTERLKALKLTLRNVPIDAAPADGACIFTGEPAVERIYVARAY